MKIKANQPVRKAMAFAGCSFTWGQGLWYYSALDSLIEDSAYGYDPGLTNTVHQEFRKKWRWPTIVAEHFDTVALTHYENGGANDQIVEYWDTGFKEPTPKLVRSFNKQRSKELTAPIKYSDVSHFVFQLTQWWRTQVEFPHQGTVIKMDVQTLWDNKTPYKKAFEDWLFSDPNANLGDFHEKIMREDVSRIKAFLQSLENNGIKTSVLAWPWEQVRFLKEDPWFVERFITFDYNGNNYDCLETMIKENKLSIEDDTEFFNQPPKDAHPSLKCQSIIAENVIRHLEKQNG